MKRLFAICLLLFSASAFSDVQVGPGGKWIRYFGSGTNDNDILFTTDDIALYSGCSLMSTTGAVDVFVSIDGTNFSTAALSLEDKGATNTNPVLVTAALRYYGFLVPVRYVRVLQNGATAAAASLYCEIAAIL